MPKELKIDTKELKEYSKEKLNRFIEYIKGKLKYEIANDGGNIILRGENIDKIYVKTLIKRFLYIERIVDDFRVLVKEEGLLLRGRRQVKMKELYH